MSTKPMPVDESVPCPRCGARLAGPWVRWCLAGMHYTEDQPAKAEPTAWAKLPERSEEDIQAGIRRALELAGFVTWTTSQKRASHVSEGLPDLLFAGLGVVGLCEVKKPGEDLRPAQQEFASVWRGNGGVCVCWSDESEAVAFARAAREVL